MNWLFFSIATALLWGTAELFYKKGARPDEQYSHLKICVWVGVIMGAHAIFTLLTQDIGYNPRNLLAYLPASAFYIISMAFSWRSRCPAHSAGRPSGPPPSGSSDPGRRRSFAGR